MKTVQLFRNMLTGLKNSLKRFPLSIALSAACAVFLIYLSELGYDRNNSLREIIRRISMVLALGIPVSLCIKLYFERLEKYKFIHLILSYLIAGALLVLYYFFLLKDLRIVSITRYIGLNIIFYIGFLFIPCLKKREFLELYVIKVLTRFFTTGIYSVVLYFGLSAILFTIDRLFGVKIQGEFYYYTWLMVSLIFAPSFFLSGIPKHDDTFDINDYPKLFRVLLLYIVMPLISVYTIILYAYFAKILVTWQWPKGLVSHLVLWYSVISAAVLFFISPILKEKSWPKTFIMFFPKLILPLIVMMFFSIGIRIKAYGITENRYFVVALGIWVFLAMLYFSFAKGLKNIVLPISLAAIVFVSIFGPVSSYSVAKYSQGKRLKALLVKNNLLIDNQIKKANTDIPKEDARNITSILRYFERYHSLNEINYLPKDFKTKDITETLGIKPEDEYYINNGFFFFKSKGYSSIDIKGYDYLIDSRNMEPPTPNSSFSSTYDYRTNTIKIFQGTKEIYSKGLNQFTLGLIDKYGMGEKNQAIEQNEMTFEDENELIKVKIQFLQISGVKNSSTDEIQNQGSDFIVIIKVK